MNNNIAQIIPTTRLTNASGIGGKLDRIFNDEDILPPEASQTLLMHLARIQVTALGAGRILRQQMLTVPHHINGAITLHHNTRRFWVRVDFVNLASLASDSIFWLVNNDTPTPDNGFPLGADDKDFVMLAPDERLVASAAPNDVDVHVVVSGL